MPYVCSSPFWQNVSFGHAVGPARTLAPPAHLAAKSDRLFRPYRSAVALVTANAFWLAAAAGLPKASPTLAPRLVSAWVVCALSPDTFGAAPAPLTLVLRYSVSVPVYSGTTWMMSRSNSGS